MGIRGVRIQNIDNELHEVFRSLAIVAAGMHFAAVASVVLPTL